MINTFPVGFDWADGATFTLSDLDWVGTPGIVTGASLDNLVDVTGLTDDDLSYTADSVTIALGPSNFLSSRSRFDIVLETSHVPEPSTYVMWAAMGLVGTGLYWKRRKE